jgi:hypothetical protein
MHMCMRAYVSVCACLHKRLTVANWMLYTWAVVATRRRRWKQWRRCKVCWVGFCRVHWFVKSVLSVSLRHSFAFACISSLVSYYELSRTFQDLSVHIQWNCNLTVFFKGSGVRPVVILISVKMSHWNGKQAVGYFMQNDFGAFWKGCSLWKIGISPYPANV